MIYFKPIGPAAHYRPNGAQTYIGPAAKIKAHKLAQMYYYDALILDPIPVAHYYVARILYPIPAANYYYAHILDPIPAAHFYSTLLCISYLYSGYKLQDKTYTT